MPARTLMDFVTGKGDPENSDAPDPLEEARAEEEKAKARYHALVQDRQEREQEIKRLRSAAERHTQEHDRTTLTPGSTEEPPPGVEQIQVRVEEMKHAEEEARAAWDAARDRRRRIARERLREEGGISDRLRSAHAAEREAVEALGRAALEKYDQVQRAIEIRKKLEREHQRLVSAADARSSQETALDRYVKNDGPPPTPEHMAGSRIIGELRWVASLSGKEWDRLRRGEPVVRDFR